MAKLNGRVVKTEIVRVPKDIYVIRCNKCGKTIFRFSQNAIYDGSTWLYCALCGNEIQLYNYDVPTQAKLSSEVPANSLANRSTNVNADKKFRVDFSDICANPPPIAAILRPLKEMARDVSNELDNIPIEIKTRAYGTHGKQGLFLYSRDTEWLRGMVLKTISREVSANTLCRAIMPDSLVHMGSSSFVNWCIDHKDTALIIVNADSGIIADDATSPKGYGRPDLHGWWKTILGSKVRTIDTSNVESWGKYVKHGEYAMSVGVIFISKNRPSAILGENSTFFQMLHPINLDFTNDAITAYLAQRMEDNRNWGKDIFDDAPMLSTVDATRLLTLFWYVGKRRTEVGDIGSKYITITAFHELAKALAEYLSSGKSFDKFFKECFCKQMNIAATGWQDTQ